VKPEPSNRWDRGLLNSATGVEYSHAQPVRIERPGRCKVGLTSTTASLSRSFLSSGS
jgi:hypothetical protein